MALDLVEIEVGELRISAEAIAGLVAGMPVSAAASDVQKNFGSYHDRALAGEAIRVTKYGRETVYIVSAKMFHALKQSQRHALAAAELSAAEMDLIDKSEVPAEQRYSLDDLT